MHERIYTLYGTQPICIAFALVLGPVVHSQVHSVMDHSRAEIGLQELEYNHHHDSEWANHHNADGVPPLKALRYLLIQSEVVSNRGQGDSKLASVNFESKSPRQIFDYDVSTPRGPPSYLI